MGQRLFAHHLGDHLDAFTLVLRDTSAEENRGHGAIFRERRQSAPTLVGDTLYTLAQDGFALLLLAMNVQDGTEQWHLILSNGETPYNPAPVVVSGKYALVQYNSTLAAVNTVTQQFLWSPRQHAFGEGIASSVPDSALWAAPAVAAGVIYVGLPDGNLYAYDLATGSLKWAFTQFDAGFAPIQSTPTVANGMVYFGRDDGVCYAVDATTGALRRMRQIPNANGASGVSAVTVAQGVVYLCAGSGSPLNLQPVAPQADVVLALDANTGRIRWQTHPSHVVGNGQIPAYTIMKQPLLLHGTLYVTGSLAPTTSTKRDVLYALDSSDGSVQWYYEALGYGDTALNDNKFFPSAPIAYNGMIYFVSGDATIYALSLA